MNAGISHTDPILLCIERKSRVFNSHADGYEYPNQGWLEDPQGRNCYLPIEVDTEFTHEPITLSGVTCTAPSPTITVQYRAVAEKEGKIFAHQDIATMARHPVVDSGFTVVDYLRSLGHDVQLERVTSDISHLPWIQIDLYAFFAIAELFRVVSGEYRDDFKDLVLKGGESTTGIVQERRLRTFTKIKGMYHPWIEMPWLMTVNSRQYAVRLAWYDTSAVHGPIGYAAFCSNTGVEIPYKDNFTSAEKADMIRMYVERPSDFDNYALGDLFNHRALMENVGLFLKIYLANGIHQNFKLPRLTTGATVRDIVEACIYKMFEPIHFDAKPRDIVNAYCKPGTAGHIKMLIASTAIYNAKIDGGRCRNNRPTDTTVDGAICDIDISGCYGEGLRVQPYPLGVPVIIDYPLTSACNQRMTLRQFIKRYGSELIPGLWQARCSTDAGYRLEHPQDYLMSWFPPKHISKMPTDTEMCESDAWWEIDNVGLLKILNHQIHLGLINHDFIQWLDNVASPGQRNEFYDQLYIETAMYYPASERVDSVEALRHAHNTHKGVNTCTVTKVKGRTTKISIEQECHAWYGITLGDMLITDLLRERKKHPKKSPLNQLLKLVINTTFGDMVSPYFTIGNVVVGNNITARARALAWYMEKALHGWQTITDGCAFDLNTVLCHDQGKVNGENCVNLYRQNLRNSNLTLKPLGGYDRIDVSKKNDIVELTLHCQSEDMEAVRLSEGEARDWTCQSVAEHLRNLFPVVDVLHAETIDVYGQPRSGQFSFEIKDFYDTGSFHGSANYCFEIAGQTATVKMRSYSKRPQERVSAEFTVYDSEYYPATTFLTALARDPHHVPRQNVYLKSRILKPGDFKKRYACRFEGSSILPGMSVKEAGLLREFSLTQFTYRDLEQFKAWEREAEGLRRRYGQSYEMFFLNPDGTLDYQRMVSTIDQMIATGKQGFWDGVDRRAENTARRQVTHPELVTLEKTRDGLTKFYGYKSIYSADEDDDVESDQYCEM